MGQLTLVLGGARSGKSDFVVHLAQGLGGEQVLFVATASVGDEEMRRRIESHRQTRPKGWRTVEIQRDVGPVILTHAGGARVVILDCLTVLLANRLMEADDPLSPGAEEKVTAEVEGLLACADRLEGRLVVVSNEVGLGVIPVSPLGRAYRDLLGRANQALARAADEVYFLTAGLPQQIKGERASRAVRPESADGLPGP
jgi:adenosylcobinamide kinase/adenosylcobinamide-phosphate guanylyltransferase